MNHHGVFYQSAGQSGFQSLPLSDIRVQVIIVDTSARVTLSARYNNVQDTSTPRCKYVFPVPASAAICAFDMQVSNGRRVKGIVKEKELAREEFEEALRAGTAAALVNYVTDDIFTISIGSIPGRSSVTTNITYVMSLNNDDNYDDIRFQLLMGVGERYGTPPTELESAFAPVPETKIKLTAHIQMSGPILSIISPSHPITESKYMHNGQASRRRSEVKFRSNDFLQRDFVLIVRAKDLDRPRCFAELQEDHRRKRHYSLAMQFTLVSKNILPPIASQEYLFVVDRSGSMSGGRIDKAKETLGILMRMVPNQGSSFNVFTFDNNVESVWPTSVAYSNVSLMQASSWIQGVHARGGTEMAQALQHALGTRRTDIPTAVFLLTDGEVYDVQPAQIVSDFVRQAPRHAPLRVFTLGIGDGISTQTCDGIARAGNGQPFYATTSDQIALKCARLFKLGRTPFVENVSVDWGIPQEYLASATTVTFPPHEPSTSRTVGIRPLSNIQQSPYVVQEIHAGSRINIFAIVALKKAFSPQEVTLRGRLKSDGSTFQTTVPIKGVQLADVHHGKLLIHTLAAWRLAQEYAEDRIPLPVPLVPTSTTEEVCKAVLVHLGEKYQLVTKHTSFVAVESWGDDRPEPPEPTPISRSNSGAPWDEPRGDEHDGVDDGEGSSVLTTLSNLLWGLLGGGRSRPTARVDNRTQRNAGAPGGWPDSSFSSGATSRDEPNQDAVDDDEGENEDDGYASDRTFTTLSSLESRNWSDWSEPSTPGTRTPPDEEPEDVPASPRIEAIDLAPETIRNTLPSRNPPGQNQQSPDYAPPEVVKLIGLQMFDGSFNLDHALEQLVGQRAIQEAGTLQVDDKVWATALSIAFIRKQMDGRNELLSDLVTKAMEFLSERVVDVDDILLRAEQVI